MLNNFRSQGERILGPTAKRLAQKPGAADRLTWASLPVAVLAGACFYMASAAAPWLLILGGVLVLINAGLDALDGMVARHAGTSSPAGDFLDHAIDRYADMFVIGGLTFCAFGSLLWGFLALTGVFITSYLGTQAAAVGLKRDYGGLMGRADRLVLLIVVPIVQGALLMGGVGAFYRLPIGDGPFPYPFSPYLTLIGFLLLVLGAFGHLTAIQRFRRARMALASANPGTPGDGPKNPP